MQTPLAEQLRPQSWQEFRGHDALDQRLLAQLMRAQGRPPSLIIWGPPGCGKTTLAKLIGRSYTCKFVEFSAVLGSVKEVREIVAQAEQETLPTILFVDEIHRFNKAQQDAFLPHVERGTISLIGATTENPSFSLTSALLSRVKVVVLPGLSEQALLLIAHDGAQELGLSLAAEAAKTLVELCASDARKLLNMLEALALNFASSTHNGSQAPATAAETEITNSMLQAYLQESKILFYDRSGEEHYNVVSAFIKSLRGSDASAALFWGLRMIEAGEDPRFVLRRMLIFASEDIGNADPRALQVAVATQEAYERLGLPEGRIPIAQCICYLACAPKSNRSYVALQKATQAIRQHPKASVPLHLRNAPTALMKQLHYGEEYIYPHDCEGGYAVGVQYLPEGIQGSIFYEPSERGYEKNLAERLAWLKSQVQGTSKT